MMVPREVPPTSLWPRVFLLALLVSATYTIIVMGLAQWRAFEVESRPGRQANGTVEAHTIESLPLPTPWIVEEHVDPSRVGSLAEVLNCSAHSTVQAPFPCSQPPACQQLDPCRAAVQVVDEHQTLLLKPPNRRSGQAVALPEGIVMIFPACEDSPLSWWNSCAGCTGTTPTRTPLNAARIICLPLLSLSCALQANLSLPVRLCASVWLISANAPGHSEKVAISIKALARRWAVLVIGPRGGDSLSTFSGECDGLAKKKWHPWDEQRARESVSLPACKPVRQLQAAPMLGSDHTEQRFVQTLRCCKAACLDGQFAALP